MTGRLPPHLPAPAVSASRAAFPAGATQPVLPGPQIPRAPPGMATVPAPPAPHAPSVCGPGVVAILSRSGCVAAPRNGRPTPDPRPGGSGTGSAAPALSLGHGDLQQTGPRGAALSHPELGRPQKHRDSPRVSEHLPRGRLARACGPRRPRAPSAACARPAPGEEPAGSRPLSPSRCVRRPPARPQVPAFFPGRSRFLRSLLSPGSSSRLILPTRPSSRPGPGLRAGCSGRGTGECHSPPRSEAPHGLRALGRPVCPSEQT